MAKATRSFVFEGLEKLSDALIPFVERNISSSIGEDWQNDVQNKYVHLRIDNGKVNWDNQALLRVITIFWHDVFRNILGPVERAYVSELIDVRNRLAHDESFTYPDAARALETMSLLMKSIGAGEVVDKLDQVIIQTRRIHDENMRRNAERRRGPANGELKLTTPAGLKPWREIVQPHEDVATNNFTQAEFAADISKVYAGTASSEYLNPIEFYARTFLTEGLKDLLVGAAHRLFGKKGDPVIELQTNFGGGKTHSMLALYHMFGKEKIQNLHGLDQILSGINFDKDVRRAVLVGTARGPSDIKSTKEGIQFNTTWGEMAYQIGGVEGYGMLRKQDENGTAPGSNLLGNLFAKFSPCLILIDEWVAYLRQIYGIEGLPSGTFDANLSFVQSLTEAVKDTPNTLLVASLPASQIEVGGQGGEEALIRLKHTFSRVHSSWLPASQEESYEIVRRRLFNDVPGNLVPDKDNTVKQYMRMYRVDADNFPQGASDSDYERHLKISYPIHPELFDQFYKIWSSIERFQRTRGILRFMALVVHKLWDSNDMSAMIMPGGIPVGEQEVSPELTKYLEHGWPAVIASDVDGVQSLPHNIDMSVPNLGQVFATRRVARALFMGTAPLSNSQNKGVDAKVINRAVAQPGEKLVRFGDALHRLAGRATYLHSNNGKYWYSTALSLNKMASDRAEKLDENFVLEAIDKALSSYVTSQSNKDIFDAVHVSPSDSSDVLDELTGCRVVVLSVQHPHSSGNKKSPAMIESRNIIDHNGSAPRIYKNVLVFLAADNSSLSSFQDAARSKLAWDQIVDEYEQHNLRPDELKTAQRNASHAKSIFNSRLKEVWKWLIYPYQSSAHDEIAFQPGSVSAQDNIFKRIQTKLETEEVLYSTLGPTRLNMILDKFIWQNNNHIKTSDLLEYHSKFVYMPRLSNRSVIEKTILSSISQLTPGPFAFAEKFDSMNKSYLGLIIENGSHAVVSVNSDSVIIRKDIAERNRCKVNSESEPDHDTDNGYGEDGEYGKSSIPTVQQEELQLPTAFHGTVLLNSDRPARDMSRIIENVIEQLTAIDDADVEIMISIRAEVPSGIDNAKQRILLENANSLDFIEKKIS